MNHPIVSVLQTKRLVEVSIRRPNSCRLFRHEILILLLDVRADIARSLHGSVGVEETPDVLPAWTRPRTDHVVALRLVASMLPLSAVHDRSSCN